MAKKSRARDEEWAIARRACRLNDRQIEMAKQLGMNPRKLPGLNPSPSQRWKLPVAAWIEEQHAKRFPAEASGSFEEPWSAPRSEVADHETRAAFALLCDLANLQGTVASALAEGRLDAFTLTRAADELKRMLDVLEGSPDAGDDGEFHEPPDTPHLRAGFLDGDLPF